jgi:hypothetical protein
VNLNTAPSGGTNVAAWSSGAVQMTTTAETTLPFVLDVVLRCTAVDSVEGTAAGTLLGQGFATSQVLQIGSGAAPGTISNAIVLLPETAPTNGTAFATSVQEYLDFFVGFSSGVAGNQIQVFDYFVEQIYAP